MSSVMPSPSLPMARSLGGAMVDGNNLSTMNAYNLFLAQLNVANQEAAVDAMKRLRCVAILSGPEVVQTELLPFLNQYVQNENPADELLLILGQQLLSVLAVTKHTITDDVLQLLERLAAIEETVVRDQAVTVLGAIVELTGSTHADAMCALCRRLASADWFTAKVSAAGIIPHLIKVVPVATQHDLLATFKELSGTDETPMVRRATAKHLGEVLAAAGWPHRDVLSVVVNSLSAINEQDSVRLLAVASLAKAGPTWGEHPNWTIQHWLPVLKEGSTDLSWRVRNHLAKHFSDVATVLGIQGDRRFQDQQTLVMSCFVALLTDAEAEVRAAAVAHVARMIAWGGPALFTSHMQPLLPALADDVVMEVRSKCAGALMDTAAQKSLDDETILAHFGPLWEAALQDEFPEVQLQVLTNLHKISALLPALHSVVTTLLSMAKASNWRVRQAVAQLLPFLAEARGAEFFETVLLESAWITLLLDSVAAVRNQIVSGVELLVKVLGPDVVYTALWPKHLQIFEMGTYLVRSSILGSWVAMAVASEEDTELYGQALSRIVLTLENDTVPNVRRRAALGLGKLTLKDTTLLEKISQSDPDPDVCQAATWALEQQNKK